jgi:hypothetical protein
VDEGEEVGGSPVVSCGEAAKVLEVAEAALDAVSVFVGVLVVWDRNLAERVDGITSLAWLSAMNCRK